MQQFLKDYGALLVFGMQILMTAVAWWYRGNVATKKDVRELTERVGTLEQANEQAPNANDMAALRLEMSHHTGQMREFSATFNGKCETLDARINGFGTLMERAENMVDMLTRHLLDANR